MLQLKLYNKDSRQHPGFNVQCTYQGTLLKQLTLFTGDYCNSALTAIVRCLWSESGDRGRLASTELWARPRSWQQQQPGSARLQPALSHSLRCLAALSQSEAAIPPGVTPPPANHRPRQPGKGEGLIKRSDSDTPINALMRSIYRGEPCLSLTHDQGPCITGVVVWIEARRAGPRLSVCHRGGRGPGQLSPILSPPCSAPPLQCGCSVREDGRLVTLWALSTLPSSLCVPPQL